MQIKVNEKIIKIRSSTLDDYRYCYLLTKKNMFPFYQQYNMEWKPESYKKNFTFKFVKVLEYKGKRAGFYKLLPKEDGWYLSDLQISGVLRNKGIGTEIMKLLEHVVKKNNYNSIKLRVFVDNPAINLYKRIGYKIIESHDNSYVMIKKF